MNFNNINLDNQRIILYICSAINTSFFFIIMKTPKYKFNEKWHEAIKRSHELYAPGVEHLVRKYIETGEDIDGEFIETDFECAWVLMKAEIDRRKARNERARERRRTRREEAERKKREAEETAPAATAKEQEKPDVHEIKDKPKARMERAEAKLRQAAPRRSSVTTRLNTTPDHSVPHGQIPPHPPIKAKFSERFRGPGLPSRAPAKDALQTPIT